MTTLKAWGTLVAGVLLIGGGLVDALVHGHALPDTALIVAGAGALGLHVNVG